MQNILLAQQYENDRIRNIYPIISRMIYIVNRSHFKLFVLIYIIPNFYNITSKQVTFLRYVKSATPKIIIYYIWSAESQ